MSTLCKLCIWKWPIWEDEVGWSLVNVVWKDAKGRLGAWTAPLVMMRRWWNIFSPYKRRVLLLKIYFHILIFTSMAEDTAESESESEICSTCTIHVMILLVGDRYFFFGSSEKRRPPRHGNLSYWADPRGFARSGCGSTQTSCRVKRTYGETKMMKEQDICVCMHCISWYLILWTLDFYRTVFGMRMNNHHHWDHDQAWSWSWSIVMTNHHDHIYPHQTRRLWPCFTFTSQPYGYHDDHWSEL